MTTHQELLVIIAAEWENTPHFEAAAREGWFLCTCEGSSYGPLQIEKVDDPVDCSKTFGIDIPELESDDEALKLVREGTEPHHVKARALLELYNPAELAYVMTGEVQG